MGLAAGAIDGRDSGQIGDEIVLGHGRESSLTLRKEKNTKAREHEGKSEIRNPKLEIMSKPEWANGAREPWCVERGGKAGGPWSVNRGRG
jgi:hypothetical protein